ncbi:MAG: hypothetical protein WEA10_06395 [Actinomycetota bacterium]
MRIVSRHPDLTVAEIRRMLEGMPTPSEYTVIVKPFRYRTSPHLSALTDFDSREIVLQVPEPFLPFGEVVPYGAMRRQGRGMRFIWLTEGVTFHTPRQVLRFLYCHEWMHWFLKERLGRKSSAETTCDRFALHNYQRRTVTEDDAMAALKRNGGPARVSGRTAARGRTKRGR